MITDLVYLLDLFKSRARIFIMHKLVHRFVITVCGSCGVQPGRFTVCWNGRTTEFRGHLDLVSRLIC